jgi:hypothetical protein
MKMTKKQKDDLFNCHVGVGFLVYKSGWNTLTSTEFYLKNNIPHCIPTGEPITYETFGEDE